MIEAGGFAFRTRLRLKPDDALCENQFLRECWAIAKQMGARLGVIEVRPKEHGDNAADRLHQFKCVFTELGREFVRRVGDDSPSATPQPSLEEIQLNGVTLRLDIAADDGAEPPLEDIAHLAWATGWLPHKTIRTAGQVRDQWLRHPLRRLVQIPLFAGVSAVSLRHQEIRSISDHNRQSDSASRGMGMLSHPLDAGTRLHFCAHHHRVAWRSLTHQGGDPQSAETTESFHHRGGTSRPRMVLSDIFREGRAPYR